MKEKLQLSKMYVESINQFSSLQNKLIFCTFPLFKFVICSPDLCNDHRSRCLDIILTPVTSRMSLVRISPWKILFVHVLLSNLLLSLITYCTFWTRRYQTI